MGQVFLPNASHSHLKVTNLKKVTLIIFNGTQQNTQIDVPLSMCSYTNMGGSNSLIINFTDHMDWVKRIIDNGGTIVYQGASGTSWMIQMGSSKYQCYNMLKDAYSLWTTAGLDKYF